MGHNGVGAEESGDGVEEETQAVKRYRTGNQHGEQCGGGGSGGWKEKLSFKVNETHRLFD